MDARRAFSCAVGLVAVLAVVGCGSSGSGATGGSTVVGSKPPVVLRGIKGESADEVQTDQHISAADCRALAGLAEDRFGTKLSRHSTPRPPLSKCRIEGSGVQINVYLDTGHGAHQRYKNRIEETVQFNTEHPSGLPRSVPHVGERSFENSSGSWIPALGSLLAVRGGRWLTVTIAVKGLADKRLEAEAATLARAGFKLTAGG